MDLNNYFGNYYGDCPRCRRSDGYVNVGRHHWIVCDACRTKWYVGSNLFSSWRDETLEVWEENAQLLSGYEEVEPFREEDIYRAYWAADDAEQDAKDQDAYDA